MLKSIVKIQLILFTAFTFSCGDDDEKKAYSFKNQDLQGEIFGASWEYTDGHAREATVNEEDQLVFALYPAYDESVCNAMGNYGDFVSIGGVPREVGLYKLNTTDPDFPIVVVSFFDVETGDAVFVQEGAIEILTITETEVTARMDARKDGGNHVNGTFVVPFCNEPD